MIQGSFHIVQKHSLAREVYSYTLSAGRIARSAQAGQFVHVLCPGHSTLRRPLSLCRIDPDKGQIRLVFEVRGEGTKALSSLREGDMMDIMGPLGHGFALLDPAKRVVVVGGGIGVPPMLEVAAHYGANCRAVLGFRSADAVILTRDFEALGCEVLLSTDDGTRGRKGFVTQSLQETLEREPADMIYACGPLPMLKGVASIARQQGIRCQVSLEERMGCGIGACLVCACKTQKDGKESYSHVCKDGPVFESTELPDLFE